MKLSEVLVRRTTGRQRVPLARGGSFLHLPADCKLLKGQGTRTHY